MDDDRADTQDAVPIAADDKDWTWVLDTACPECGFDASALPTSELGTLAMGELLRYNVAAWSDVLATGGRELTVRPRPERWSTLEYACHVRDVFRLFGERLQLMLDEDGPHFGNWDQDATAVHDRYGEQDPTTVGRELSEAGEQLAEMFDGVRGDQWQRTGYRSDGASFTVDSFARYLMHDPVHHLWDVGVGR